MLIAIAVRIIVVIFVPGFGSHRELQHPSLFIGFLDKMKGWLGIGETQGMMLLSRSLYALVSLFTVSIIYRICDLTVGKQNAWLLALIPVFSIMLRDSACFLYSLGRAEIKAFSQKLLRRYCAFRESMLSYG